MRASTRWRWATSWGRRWRVRPSRSWTVRRRPTARWGCPEWPPAHATWRGESRPTTAGRPSPTTSSRRWTSPGTHITILICRNFKWLLFWGPQQKIAKNKNVFTNFEKFQKPKFFVHWDFLEISDGPISKVTCQERGNGHFWCQLYH